MARISFHQCGYCKYHEQEILHSKILGDILVGYCDNELCEHYHTERGCSDLACDQMDDSKPNEMSIEVLVSIGFSEEEAREIIDAPHEYIKGLSDDEQNDLREQGLIP